MNLKIITTLSLMSIITPAFADSIKNVELCPSDTLKEVPEVRYLKNYNRTSNSDRYEFLLCGSDRVILSLNDNYNYTLSSLATCNQILNSMAANPMGAYLFKLDYYERTVLSVTLQKDRICDSKGIIRNVQGTMVNL